MVPCKKDFTTYAKKNLLTDTKKHTAYSHGKFSQQIPAPNSRSKFSPQIPSENSRICNAEDDVEYPLCGRASHVNIKREQVTKQKFIKT